ncbi:unc-43 [Symbiodinium microadriaticum]|nr:unc-43 [Symbiodinium microadriaticum]
MAAYVTVSMVFTFVINFAYGWGPMVWVYCAEMFPLRSRSRCVGVTTMSSWIVEIQHEDRLKSRLRAEDCDSEVFSTASPDTSVESLTTALEEDYKVKKVLGQGKFGLVQEVVRKGTKQSFAVKVVSSNKQSEDEIQLMASLRHENIVCLHDSLEHDEMLYIIMELCSGGTLRSWIEDRYNEHLNMQVYTAPPKRVLANCIWQILDALKYLHGRGFVHRDIKLENLLLLNAGKCPQLKLADFGMATEFQKGELMTQRCGSPGYMAPEVVRGGYTELCDLWSVGIVFYQLATGKRLWPLTPTHEQHYDQVLAETPLTLKSDAYWNRLGPGALEMAQDLLSLECSRPTAACTIENDWLRKHVLGGDDGWGRFSIVSAMSWAHVFSAEETRGNYLIAQLSPVLLEGLGLASFFVFAGFSAAALGLACWLPETRGVALEDIERLFDERFGAARTVSSKAKAQILGLPQPAEEVSVLVGKAPCGTEEQGESDAMAAELGRPGKGREVQKQGSSDFDSVVK